jgi:anionic cell wall polymer biosynthesis LytR-Cps2A-Psr (LCP) family protein
MTTIEEQLRRVLDDASQAAPAAPDRGPLLRRRIARRRRIRVAGLGAVTALALTATGAVIAGTAHRGAPVSAPVVTGPRHVAVSGARNVLLVGVDGGRADSITLLHLDAAHGTAYLVPIPGDAYVDVPAYSGYAGGRMRIGDAFAAASKGMREPEVRRRGFGVLAGTVANLTGGARIDAGAVVDVAGLRTVVDALGGVDMYIDEETTSVHTGFDAQGRFAAPFTFNADGSMGAPVPGVTPVVYHVGTVHLSPSQAVDYLRQRVLLANGDGDYGLQRHRMQFLRAVFTTLRDNGTLRDPVKLDRLLRAIRGAVTIDTGAAGIEDWLSATTALGAGDLVLVKTNAGRFNPVTVPGGGTVESLTADSLALLRAVGNDTVGRFLESHPDWVVA